MKKIISVFAILFALTMVFALPAGAAKNSQTYTYSMSGFALLSPDAYTPVDAINSDYMGLETPLDSPHDIVVDENDNIYIADMGNSRIVVLNRYFNFQFEINEFINEQGIEDKLNKPQGVFVTPDRDGEEGIIYVCDTDQNRIVTFDKQGNFIRVIPQPKDSLFDEGAVYKPIAIAVDDYNRLYVVSSTTYQGIIVMGEDGTFIRFVGAQKVAISAWDRIWRMFQTDDQRELTAANISTEFNNITIDDTGFIYVTTSTIDPSKVRSAITSKSKSGDYAPVKMLNQSGDEVMARNGFWPPAGEIDLSGRASEGAVTGVSEIIDVAIGPENTWSIIDASRQKIFTYDDNGNLLFAFGDKGSQLGNLKNVEGITYMSDGKMLVLDKTDDNFTVYTRTEYGDILIAAIEHQNNRLYDQAKQDWEEILKRNSNFDAAYIGIGDALYRNGEYAEALDYYEAAYDTQGWSDSYKEIRKAWIAKYVLLIPVIVIVIVLAVAFVFKKAAKVNKRAATAGGKRTFVEELLYGFHLIFHPFDGFWDLKHEKRGSLRAAIVYVVVTVVVFFYQAIGSGYLVNPNGSYTTVFAQALSVLVPLFLWVVANWCLTTLFDGEGSFKDIFIATSYSLLPLILLVVPCTIYTNFALKEELDITDLLVTVAFIWTLLLIYVGMQVTHDYTLSKNFITSLGTIVAMVFIMFIAILFTTLVGKIVSFITNIVIEISYRM